MSTLSHKRCLVQAFQNADSSSYKEIGLLRKIIRASMTGKLYQRKKNGLQQLVQNFYADQSSADPCKSHKKRQLLKPVKDVYRDFKKSHPSAKVSLRTIYCLKPKNVASVGRAKFCQCLCEICFNPKLKLQMINRHLMRRCECVRDLLVESVRV